MRRWFFDKLDEAKEIRKELKKGFR
jgi:hypothetical protein